MNFKIKANFTPNSQDSLMKKPIIFIHLSYDDSKSFK